MIAVVDGTWLRPEVELAFGYHDTHRGTGELLRDWVKTIPGRRYDRSSQVWTLTGIGPDAEQELTRAGFVLVDPDGELVDLHGLVRAAARLRPGDPDGLWEVHARLGGRDVVAARLGVEALWRSADECWLVPASVLAGADGEPWADLDVAAWREAVAAEQPVADRPGQPASVPAADLLRYDQTLDGLRAVPVTDLKSVPAAVAESMAAVGVESVHDLLNQIPHRYLDLSNPVPASADDVGERVVVLGTVDKVTAPPPKDRGGMLKATVKDAEGTRISCRWFHNPYYVKKRLKPGASVVLMATLEEFGSGAWRGFGMTNPVVEPVEADNSGSIIGIYPASGKNDLTTWAMFRAASEATRRLGVLVDPVPDGLAEAHGLMGRSEAFHAVHDPASLDEAARGRDRLAYDELLRLQLVLATSRAQLKAEDAFTHHGDGTLTGQYLARQRFSPTGAQSRAVESIIADMRQPKPMGRLLMGDVGSGKTLVSILTMLEAVESGWQAALVAPTEILATQHFEGIAADLDGLVKADGTPVVCALLTNKVTGAARKQAIAGLADGTIDVVIGTHAVLAETVAFKALSCVVVDEQHRFGVDQRRALRGKSGDRTPDMLYASATPIPRTSAMTTFGDLDVSVLDEMPPGRSPVETVVVADADAADRDDPTWRLVRHQVEDGHQAFVVTPLVSSSQAREAAAAHETAEQLAAGALDGLRVGVVTGKDKPDQRRETMASFAAGDLDVLVATTVIEVGVNVPNATVMVVLGADKFGLAQLHQLRGRVGRGRWPGRCVLVGQPKTATGVQRLEAMEATTDGFRLAELDLRIRGVGKMMGSDQSGRGRDLKVADVMEDAELLEWAKRDAETIVDGDPHLARRPGLRAEVAAAVGAEGADWLRAV